MEEDGKKMKLNVGVPTDFDKAWIKKLRIRFRRPEDSQSQELECALIDSQGSDDTDGPPSKIMKLTDPNLHPAASSSTLPPTPTQPSAVYMKEIIPQPEDGVYKIWTTRDLNNEWANCSMTLKRKTQTNTSMLRSVFKGPFQKAVLKKFIAHFSEHDDYVLVESDWVRLEELAVSGPAEGILLTGGQAVEDDNENEEEDKDENEEEDKDENEEDDDNENDTSGSPASYLFLLKKDGENILCYSTERRSGNKGFARRAICRYPGCLSQRNTTHNFPWCAQHKGVDKFGVVEFYHCRGDTNSILSTAFSFSVGEGQSDVRKKELFKIAWNASVKSSQNWKTYKKEVKNADYSEKSLIIINSPLPFDTAEEAEKYAAVIRTTRLMSMFAGSLLGGKKMRLINLEIPLAHKCEGEMHENFTKATGLAIHCVKVDPARSFPLPQQMGIRPSSQTEKPKDGWGVVYIKSNKDIGYSGKHEKDEKGRMTAQKRPEQAIHKYNQATGRNINDWILLFDRVESLEETENIVNTAMYFAHLFKVPNPITKEDFICLNKEVKTSVIDKFELVKDFCRHFFKIDITFMAVPTVEGDEEIDVDDEWSFV